MCSRQGRCGNCEYCIIDVDENIKRVVARCGMVVNSNTGLAKMINIERQRYYLYGDRKEDAIEIVKEKNSKLLAPKWCPMEVRIDLD